MNTGTIELRRFSLHAEAALLPSLIDCYQEVYGGPEWNEWWGCAIKRHEEGHHWGRHQEAEVQALGMTCCGRPIEIYWRSERVEDAIRKEVTEEASCWICLDGDRVVGACWGYPAFLDELEALKFRIPVAARIRELVGPIDKIAYQSEAILRKPYRGQRLYQEMVRLRQADFLEHGLTATVVRTRRTNPAPSKSFLYSQKYGYTIVAEYPEADGRVIQARSMIDLGEHS